MKTIKIDAFQGKPDVEFLVIGTFDEGLVLKLNDKRFRYQWTFLHFTEESADVPYLEQVASQHKDYLRGDGSKCWLLKTKTGSYVGQHTYVEDDGHEEE